MQSENGKTVSWADTIRFLAIRSVAAGLVGTAIIAIAGAPLEQLPLLFVLPLVWPVIVFFYFGAFYLFGKIAKLFPTPMPELGSLIINLATLLAFLAIIIGDPLVWLINKLFPRVVNIRDLRFINPYFFIYVHR